MGNRVIRNSFLVRFDAPDAEEVHVLGVDEVGGGGNRLPDFVLLGKILPFRIPHLVTHHHH